MEQRKSNRQEGSRILVFPDWPEVVSCASHGVEGLSPTASHGPWLEAGSSCPGEGFSEEDFSGKFPKSFKFISLSLKNGVKMKDSKSCPKQ